MIGSLPTSLLNSGSLAFTAVTSIAGSKVRGDGVGATAEAVEVFEFAFESVPSSAPPIVLQLIPETTAAARDNIKVTRIICISPPVTNLSQTIPGRSLTTETGPLAPAIEHTYGRDRAAKAGALGWGNVSVPHLSAAAMLISSFFPFWFWLPSLFGLYSD